jgi:hypothetical protein
MKRFLSKCTSCAGGIGICICTIFMSLSVIGAAAVGLSKNANSGIGMEDMGNMTTTISPASLTFENIIINFFSGFWGEVILLVSLGLMLTGMWLTGKQKVMPLSIAGVVILYIGMYAYYSITLEVVGIVMLAIAYSSAYSYQVAKMIKLV